VSLRAAIRKASPAGLRLTVALARRSMRDSALWGPRVRLATGRAQVGSPRFLHLVARVEQEIKRSAFFAGKLANIMLGAKLLDGVVIAPGETLSFWKLIGRPTAAAGFQVGRSIRGGAVTGDLGGGLCQLSGIVYEAGLRAGLEPVERFAHSRDLYAEQDRFTPLGLDATVVWPYKDLRLTNPFPVPVQFRFTVGEGTIACAVFTQEPALSSALEVTRVDHDGWRQVRVARLAGGAAAEVISEDRYIAPPPAPSDT
jgi:vancomycin resistance protein VanW